VAMYVYWTEYIYGMACIINDKISHTSCGKYVGDTISDSLTSSHPGKKVKFHSCIFIINNSFHLN